MTPDARRHYRELLGGFPLEPMGDDEAGQFLADLCEKPPAGVPLRRVVRLAMALLEAPEDPALDEERASACEQDSCGICNGCVEGARQAFERGDEQCLCCLAFDGTHQKRNFDGEDCLYAETYSAEQRAEHMAIGLARLESEGTTTT